MAFNTICSWNWTSSSSINQTITITISNFKPHTKFLQNLDFYLDLKLYSHLVNLNRVKKMILELMELKQPLDSWQTKFMKNISYNYIQLLQVKEHEQR